MYKNHVQEHNTEHKSIVIRYYIYRIYPKI